jgi:hypothetical protein
MSYKIDKIISEELLRNLFSIYGEVWDTTIKQISIDRVRFMCLFSFSFYLSQFCTIHLCYLVFRVVLFAPKLTWFSCLFLHLNANVVRNPTG